MSINKFQCMECDSKTTEYVYFGWIKRHVKKIHNLEQFKYRINGFVYLSNSLDKKISPIIDKLRTYIGMTNCEIFFKTNKPTHDTTKIYNYGGCFGECKFHNCSKRRCTCLLDKNILNLLNEIINISNDGYIFTATQVTIPGVRLKDGNN